MRQKPRILLVIEGTYPWYRGGVSEWVYQYIKAFDHVEFAIVQVATGKFYESSLNKALYEVPGHVTHFLQIPPPQITNNWKKDSTSWIEAHGEKLSPLFQYVDCVHIANTGFAGWLGMILAGQNNKPLVLTEHALYWKEVQMGAVALECGYKIPEENGGKKYITSLFKKIAGRIYSTADHLISVSECNIKEQKSLGACQVQYIPNGVDADWLKSEKRDSETLTFGWIGRCAEMKNPLRFFDIADTLGEDAEYVMMLCDAGEQSLKKQVIERGKKYPGLKQIWNRPAAEYIDEMDALCITSHNESQPLVLFEALSRRVLPVGWEVGDVTDKYAVVVSKQSSAAGLAERIRKLWDKPQQWKEELNTRFNRLKKYHTWQSIFDQYKTVMKPYLMTSNKNTP